MQVEVGGDQESLFKNGSHQSYYETLSCQLRENEFYKLLEKCLIQITCELLNFVNNISGSIDMLLFHGISLLV